MIKYLQELLTMSRLLTANMTGSIIQDHLVVGFFFLSSKLR